MSRWLLCEGVSSAARESFDVAVCCIVLPVPALLDIPRFRSFPAAPELGFLLATTAVDGGATALPLKLRYDSVAVSVFMLIGEDTLKRVRELRLPPGGDTSYVFVMLPIVS